MDYVRRVIDSEWVERLGDLVERRLMLLFDPGFSMGTLNQLASLLAEAGKLNRADLDVQVASYREYLVTRFGKQLTSVGS